MRTIQYTNIDKRPWGAGPWVDEADKVQYPDPETGLPCLLVRHPESGHWCGYVGVPSGHPWHGVEYDDCKDKDGDYVFVHGGLTFATGCQTTRDECESVCHVPDEGEPDDVWWLGFDCAHAGDKCPATDARAREHGYYRERDDVYRDIGFVTTECSRLAAQAMEVSHG